VTGNFGINGVVPEGSYEQLGEPLNHA
jgi:hypothetical protein